MRCCHQVVLHMLRVWSACTFACSLSVAGENNNEIRPAGFTAVIANLMNLLFITQFLRRPWETPAPPPHPIRGDEHQRRGVETAEVGVEVPGRGGSIQWPSSRDGSRLSRARTCVSLSWTSQRKWLPLRQMVVGCQKDPTLRPTYCDGQVLNSRNCRNCIIHKEKII